MKTPVLFETFARPMYARQVFEQLKKIKPTKLYFYSNKARNDRPDELKNNEEIRSWVKEIDWDCELHTFFRDEYVEIYPSLQGAIDWVFQHEEKAIILEDDCVPSLAFFEFVDKYIDVYQHNQEIAFITGDNYLKNLNYQNADHFITTTFFMFGWATWRDRWQSTNFSYDIDKFLANQYLKNYFPDKLRTQFWSAYYLNIKEFLIRTHCWDYMFGINCITKKQYGIAPVQHLVQNVGLIGSHANGKKNKSNIECVPLDSHYKFTGKLLATTPYDEYDLKLFKEFFGLTSTAKIKRLIKNIVKAFLGNTLYNKLKNIKNQTHISK